MKGKVFVKDYRGFPPMSRSQAKRLCGELEKYKSIELDFDGIDEIGWSFAHEIFVVFYFAHRNIDITPINMSEEVRKMVERSLWWREDEIKHESL